MQPSLCLLFSSSFGMQSGIPKWFRIKVVRSAAENKVHIVSLVANGHMPKNVSSVASLMVSASRFVPSACLVIVWFFIAVGGVQQITIPVMSAFWLYSRLPIRRLLICSPWLPLLWITLAGMKNSVHLFTPYNPPPTVGAGMGILLWLQFAQHSVCKFFVLSDNHCVPVSFHFNLLYSIQPCIRTAVATKIAIVKFYHRLGPCLTVQWFFGQRSIAVVYPPKAHACDGTTTT